MVTVLLLSAIIPPLVVFSFGGGRDVLTSRDDFPDSVGTRPDVVSRDDADRLQTIGESGDLGWKQYSTMCRSRVGSWCYRCCQLAASATPNVIWRAVRPCTAFRIYRIVIYRCDARSSRSIIAAPSPREGTRSATIRSRPSASSSRRCRKRFVAASRRS